jgi:hypothetical protein
MLKVADNDIRYKADSFVFNVAGAPEEVKQFSGNAECFLFPGADPSAVGQASGRGL